MLPRRKWNARVGLLVGSLHVSCAPWPRLIFDIELMIDPSILPTERPTKTQWKVVLILLSALFIALGFLGLIVAFRMRGENNPFVAVLARRSFYCLAAGVLCAWGQRWFGSWRELASGRAAKKQSVLRGTSDKSPSSSAGMQGQDRDSRSSSLRER